MHRYSAILFDLGGTLVYRIVTQDRILRLLCDELRVPLLSEPDWTGAVSLWRAYHASHYLSCRTVEQEESLLHREARLILDHLCGGNCPPDAVDLFRQGLQRASRWWSVYDDVMPVLNYLKSTGIRAGIVSNWEPSLERFCQEMGLSHAFHTIVSSVREGVEKPSPRLFETALARIGVRAEDAVYVGDDYRSDVVGARAAGMTPLLLDRNDRYLSTDCLKIGALDQVIDFLRGDLQPPPQQVVCFSGFSL